MEKAFEFSLHWLHAGDVNSLSTRDDADRLGRRQLGIRPDETGLFSLVFAWFRESTSRIEPRILPLQTSKELHNAIKLAGKSGTIVLVNDTIVKIWELQWHRLGDERSSKNELGLYSQTKT